MLMIKTSNGRYRAATKREVCETAALYAAPAIVGMTLSSPRATRHFLQQQLGWRDAEVFCAIYVDNRSRVIKFETLFSGTIDGCSVHPRIVVARALELNAAALIFAHNHPSGVAEPSQADELITRRLKEALALIDVRVLDHLIIGGSGADSIESFAERGLL